MDTAQEVLDAQIESYIIERLEVAGAAWVEVAKLRDGAGFRMAWNDGVVNAWTFEDPLLSVVLMRLAALVACGEFDFTAFFATDDTGFAAAARAFLDAQTSPPDPTWHGGPAKPTITHVDGEWCLWIPPTTIWCYEGGHLDGAILDVWGNTYWPSHAEACEFLGQAVIDGKVPTP